MTDYMTDYSINITLPTHQDHQLTHLSGKAVRLVVGPFLPHIKYEVNLYSAFIRIFP